MPRAPSPAFPLALLDLNLASIRTREHVTKLAVLRLVAVPLSQCKNERRRAGRYSLHVHGGWEPFSVKRIPCQTQDDVLAYNVGNDVLTATSTNAAPFSKADALDVRRAGRRSNPAPVGYADIDDIFTFRDGVLQYLICDGQGVRARV
ncbi:hypothetical protein C8R45DRAFT_935026 [Mycena sanguinolenta]|nr:hypothetical protein C8R45DRAFT_935026 [Mycena sanguinolenta]